MLNIFNFFAEKVYFHCTRGVDPTPLIGDMSPEKFFDSLPKCVRPLRPLLPPPPIFFSSTLSRFELNMTCRQTGCLVRIMLLKRVQLPQIPFEAYHRFQACFCVLQIHSFALIFHLQWILFFLRTFRALSFEWDPWQV